MSSIHEALAEHLAWWELRSVESDTAYDRWQTEAIPADDLRRLQQMAVQKSRDPVNSAKETAFYDCAAAPAILPILYSQRYAFYLAVGPLIAERLSGAGTVLDFGCGPGILTTFYARLCPGLEFVGIDRSQASLSAARAHAGELGLKNVRFEYVDADTASVPSRYDVIIATHALLQVEHDPGLPSRTWSTFERDPDQQAQREFEERTGLGRRIDHLCSALAPSGLMMLLEKAHHLGRRIALQRALAGRGLYPVQRPVPVRYRSFEEMMDDGPLYVLKRTDSREPRTAEVWNETPDWDTRNLLYACPGQHGTHVKRRLPARTTVQTEIRHDDRRGEMTVESGMWQGGAYLEVTTNDGHSALIVGPREAIEDLRRDPAAVDALAPGAPPEERLGTEPLDLPLYENHTPGAQLVWAALEARQVVKEVTREEAGGRQMHVELGVAGALSYLYCANTFDQRQLVVVERGRASVIEQYYEEIVNPKEESPS
jgi:SAM-dependent methyltransferase